jgi:threonine dehydrogenase-like Zn-dependent dehydrogenase
MPAAIFAGEGRLEIGSRTLPALTRPDDVLVQVEACGICGTDLKILERPQAHPATEGVVLGHEILGVVDEAGPEAHLAAGDRVVIAPNIGCGLCAACRRGLPNQCPNMRTLGIHEDGGLATRLRAPASACFRIAADVPGELAVLAEPLSTVAHGARLAAVFPGESALVLGAGPAGLMFTALLAAGGARVVVAEPAATRARLASALGAHEVLDPGRDDVAAAMAEITGGVGADVVVDAVGSQLATALAAVRAGGRIVLFGMNTEARTDVAQERITRRGLTLLGAYVGVDMMPLAVDILEQGAVDLTPLVTHRIDLDALPAALDDLRRGDAVKVGVGF